LDVSRFRLGDWILVVAGAVMLVLGLAVPWTSVELEGLDLGGAQNAFSYPFTGGLAWVLVVGAGVITFLRAAELMGDGAIPWTRLTVLATALAVLLMLLRLLLGPGGGTDRVSLGRDSGMIIAVLASAAALGGAYLNHRAEGGSLTDLWPFERGTWRTRSTLPPPRGPARPGDDVPPPPV
jgi:hypothetical protein